MTSTLSSLQVIIIYSYLFVTLVASVYALFKFRIKRIMVVLGCSNIVGLITSAVLFLFNSIPYSGRELLNFYTSISKGSFWAWIVLFFAVLSLTWWALFLLLTFKTKTYKIITLLITFILLILFGSTFLKFNETTETIEVKGSVPNEIVFTYSNLVATPSIIVHTKGNEIINNYEVATKGLVSPKSKGKSLLIPSASLNELFEVDLANNTINKRQIFERHNYFDVLNDEIISSHPDKDDINFNVFNVDRTENDLNIKLEGFIRTVAKDAEYYYVFADIVLKSHGRLYVLNQKTGTLHKKIDLSNRAADDMKVFNGKLIMTTKPQLTIVNLKTWKMTDFNLQIEDLEPGILNLSSSNELIVTYRNKQTLGDLTIVVFDQNFKLQKTIKLNNFHFINFFKDNRLYVFKPAQDFGNKNAKSIGSLMIYDTVSWKEIGSVSIPRREHNLSGIYVQ